jgi:hypothetical protein
MSTDPKTEAGKEQVTHQRPEGRQAEETEAVRPDKTSRVGGCVFFDSDRALFRASAVSRSDSIIPTGQTGDLAHILLRRKRATQDTTGLTKSPELLTTQMRFPS